MLKSYKVLNHTGQWKSFPVAIIANFWKSGFVKILKKMEKGTKIPCSKSYGIKLEAANFVKADKLDQLIRDTEDGFAKGSFINLLNPARV